MERPNPTNEAEPVLAVTGARKAFGAVQALSGVDLEVGSGEIVALLGPSGCGKTTMLRTIAGLERLDGGSIALHGRVLSGDGVHLQPERRAVGIVFQDYALFPHLDVAGNVGYALGRRPDRERVDAVLGLVGLADWADRPVHDLSGGEQQRVALARALAAAPELILLDEPFSNLDASLRDRMRREVRRILIDSGATSIFVTHDQEEALSIADRVAVMNAGRIEQVGAPEEIYSRPANHWVAEFLGEAVVLPGAARNGSVDCELGSVPSSGGFEGPADVIIRPESIGLDAGPAPGRASSYPGTVVERDFYGHDQLLHVALESGSRIRCRRIGFPAWHPGDRVQVWIEGPVTVLPARRQPSAAQ